MAPPAFGVEKVGSVSPVSKLEQPCPRVVAELLRPPHVSSKRVDPPVPSDIHSAEQRPRGDGRRGREPGAERMPADRPGQIVRLLPVVLRLEVLEPVLTSRDDHPHRLAVDANVELLLAALDAGDGRVLREFPTGAIGFDSTGVDLPPGN